MAQELQSDSYRIRASRNNNDMRTLIIIISLLLIQPTFSQDKVERDLDKNYIECLYLYEFVIDNFVDLVNNIYEGDKHYFVIVEYIDNTPSLMRNEIRFTYTQSYQTLLDYEFALFYKCEEHDNVYIIMDRFNSNKLKVFFAEEFQAKVITTNTLLDIFYPLTYEFEYLSKPENNNKNINDLYVFKRSEYSVISTDDEIIANENAYRIVYFTDYKRKYFSGKKNNLKEEH